jgi:hypothetical protein
MNASPQTTRSLSPTATPALRAVTLWTTEAISGNFALSRKVSAERASASSAAVTMFTIQRPSAAELRSMAKRQNPSCVRSP